MSLVTSALAGSSLIISATWEAQIAQYHPHFESSLGNLIGSLKFKREAQSEYGKNQSWIHCEDSIQRKRAGWVLNIQPDSCLSHILWHRNERIYPHTQWKENFLFSVTRRRELGWCQGARSQFPYKKKMFSFVCLLFASFWLSSKNKIN